MRSKIARLYLLRKVAGLLDALVESDYALQMRNEDMLRKQKDKEHKEQFRQEEAQRKEKERERQREKGKSGVAAYVGGGVEGLRARDKATILRVQDNIQKSSMKQIVARYKDKRFKHPLFGKDPKVTDEDVSFYTVYGWLDSRDKVRRGYAERLFEQLLKSMGGLDVLDEFIVEKKDGKYLKRLDLDRDVTAEDLDKISDALRSSLQSQKKHFGADGFFSRVLKSNLGYYKNLAKGVVDIAKKGVDSLGEVSGLFYKQLGRKNPELTEAVKRSADEYLATEISSFILEPVLSELPLLLTKSLGVFGGALGGVASFGLSSVCSLFVTGLITAVKGSKSIENTMDYDKLTADIIRGVVTPSAIEAKYRNKIEGIMSSQMSVNAKYDQLVETMREFEERTKPQMEKALYLMGKGDGSNILTFFKRASARVAAEEDIPLVYQMRTLHSYLSGLKHFDAILKDKEKMASVMNDVFRGSTPIETDLSRKMGSYMLKQAPNLLSMNSAMEE